MSSLPKPAKNRSLTRDAREEEGTGAPALCGRGASRRIVLELLVLPLQVLHHLQELLLLQLLLHDVGLVHDVALRSTSLHRDARGKLVLEEVLQKVASLALLHAVVGREARRGRGQRACSGSGRGGGGEEDATRTWTESSGRPFRSSACQRTPPRRLACSWWSDPLNRRRLAVACPQGWKGGASPATWPTRGPAPRLPCPTSSLASSTALLSLSLLTPTLLSLSLLLCRLLAGRRRAKVCKVCLSISAAPTEQLRKKNTATRGLRRSN